jgi:hypothetical protein
MYDFEWLQGSIRRKGQCIHRHDHRQSQSHWYIEFMYLYELRQIVLDIPSPPHPGMALPEVGVVGEALGAGEQDEGAAPSIRFSVGVGSEQRGERRGDRSSDQMLVPRWAADESCRGRSAVEGRNADL